MKAYFEKITTQRHPVVVTESGMEIVSQDTFPQRTGYVLTIYKGRDVEKEIPISGDLSTYFKKVLKLGYYTYGTGEFYVRLILGILEEEGYARRVARKITHVQGVELSESEAEELTDGLNELADEGDWYE